MFSVRKFYRVLNILVLVYTKYGLIWQKNQCIVFFFGMIGSRYYNINRVNISALINREEKGIYLRKIIPTML